MQRTNLIKGYTLIELLSATALIAVIIVGVIIFMPNMRKWSTSVRDKTDVVRLNDALARYKGTASDLSVLDGPIGAKQADGTYSPAPNSTAHNLQVINALVAGVEEDNLWHKFVELNSGLDRTKYKSVGTGLNFWFTGVGQGSKNLDVPIVLGSMEVTFPRNTPITYPLPITSSLTIQYSATALPTWATLNDKTGVLTGVAPTVATYTIPITATTTSGSITKNLIVHIVENLPTITSGDTMGILGNSMEYTIVATNDPTSYNASGLPNGLTLEDNKIVGIPTKGGEFHVTLTATNSAGATNKTITVMIVTSAPEITSKLTDDATVGEPYIYQITSTSGTEYAAQNLPSGFSISAATGQITGTPKIQEVCNITLIAKNGKGTGSAILVLTISSPAQTVIDIIP